MSNAQAEALRQAVLGSDDPAYVFVTLKPIAITPKRLKKLSVGDMIDGFDPLHLRIVQGDRVIARAKLGQVGGREAIHIVSTQAENLPLGAPGKSHLLSARLRKLPDASIALGEVIEYPEPLSGHLVLLADHTPFASGELVAYEGEPMVRITGLFDA